MTDRQRDITDYLRDILENCEAATQFVQGLDFDQFKNDLCPRYAVERAFEIVGEAVKQLPTEYLNAHPEVPWRLMARFRDKLIHGYDHIEPAIVWQTVTADAPEIAKHVRELLGDGSDDLGDQ